jgi:DNA repair protein RadC
MDSLKKLNIKQWAAEDRPREKMLLKGPSALSNAELLAILIGSGTREGSALAVAQTILDKSQNSLNVLGKKSVKDLQKEKGIGEARSISIMAAMELGKRRKMEDAKEIKQITSSSQAYDYFQPLLCDLQHEEFWVLFLNRSNAVIEHFNMSKGGTSGTVIDVRIIMKRGIELLASSIVLGHNHPSGNAKPSQQDKDITSKITEAGKLVEMTVVDHIIVCEHTYFSFADEGLLS